MALHDANYKHWDGSHLGIWRRRAVIAQTGLKGCLQSRWMRHIVTVCWSASLAQVAVLFLIGQLLVADSLVVRWVRHAGGEIQTLVRGLIIWLTQHPEISVRTTQNLLFYLFSTTLLTISLVAIALAIPHLITRDISSKAIIIYSSKAISRFDYLLGKFATVMGLLVITWLGPICAAWFVGNLLAPNWGFFWHSRMALFHMLIYMGSSMVILSLLALGVSAVSAKEKATVSLWIGLWLLGNSLVAMSESAKPWLKYFSFRFNLDQIALSVFQLGHELKLAQDNIPFGSMFRGVTQETINRWNNPDISGALIGLAVMLVIAVAIISRRVKPE